MELILDKRIKNVWIVLSLISLLIYFMTYLANCFGPPIRSDGEGYYIYLPALFLHADPSFEAVASERFDGQMPSWTGLEPVEETGRLLNKYNLGTSLMMTPFFLSAHVITWIMRPLSGAPEWYKFNYSSNGYSFFYQHAAGLAGLFYYMCGLLLLAKFLSKSWQPRIVIWTLFASVCGSNLLHYMSGETVLSHPYTFFLVAWLIHLTDRWRLQARSSDWLELGVCMGLLLLVRTSNLIFATYFIIHVLCRTQIRQWLSLTSLKGCGLSILACIAIMLPQLLMWRYGTGDFLVNSYGKQGEGFNFLQPAIFQTLFSLRGGLFFWCPAFLISAYGILISWKKNRPLAYSITVTILVFLYISSSWHMWWYGGGLGNRGLLDVYPFLILAMPFAFSSRWGRVFRFLTIPLVLWALFWMKLYHTREISYYGLNQQALFDVFWWRKETLAHWIQGLLY